MKKIPKKVFTIWEFIYIISHENFVNRGAAFVMGDINVFTGPMKCGKTRENFG